MKQLAKWALIGLIPLMIGCSKEPDYGTEEWKSWAKSNMDFTKYLEEDDKPTGQVVLDIEKNRMNPELILKKINMDTKDRIYIDTVPYVVLDKIIDKSIERLGPIDTTKAYAIKSLETIGQILDEHNFIYKNNVLLSDALTPTKLDSEIVEYIQKNDVTAMSDSTLLSIEGPVGTFLRENRENLNHIVKNQNEYFHYADCDNLSLIYLSVADKMNYPLKAVTLKPNISSRMGHMFLRWEFSDGSHLDWDTTSKRKYEFLEILYEKSRDSPVTKEMINEYVKYSGPLSKDQLRVVALVNVAEKLNEESYGSLGGIYLKKAKDIDPNYLGLLIGKENLSR